MSAYNDMDLNNFIIKRDDSTTDFFRKWDELLTSAKAERLLDYLSGKTHVKPEADVEALNKSRLSFFQTALIKQTKHDESSLTQQIWQEITDNELYANLYVSPIIAVNQNFPTQEEIENSRTRICTIPTLTWHTCTKKMKQSYRSTIKAEMQNVNPSDLQTTLLVMDLMISTKN
jgi:hypothetical protein